MSTHSPLSLDQVLEQQVACAEAILETLRHEQHALRSGDPYLLNTIGANKAQLVEAMEAFEIERQQLTPGPAPETYRDEPLRRHWDRLLGLIEQCRSFNQRNGALVAARRNQILQTLQLLRGGDAHEIYDAVGSTHRTSSSSLGAA